MAWGGGTSKWNHRGKDAGGLLMFLIDTTLASVNGTTKIYEGNQIVGTTGGYPKLGGSSLASGDRFAGVAAADVAWTIGEAGVYVPVWTMGTFLFALAGTEITDVFDTAWVDSAANPWTIKASYDTNAAKVGMIAEPRGTTHVWVNITGYASSVGGIAAA